jgi:hypothetical protein
LQLLASLIGLCGRQWCDESRAQRISWHQGLEDLRLFAAGPTNYAIDDVELGWSAGSQGLDSDVLESIRPYVKLWGSGVIRVVDYLLWSGPWL